MTPTTATIHVICVGDELLRGDTTNTNLADLGQLLERHGLAVADEQCVPDDHDAILRALRHAAHDDANAHDGEPESAVILVGGLGPTSDDLTRPVTAEFLGRALQPSPAVRQAILDHLGDRADRLPPDALDTQSLVPEGADVLPNPNGTAPGLALRTPRTLFALLPGPPRECLPMAEQSLVPLLTRLDGARPTLTLELRACCLPESQAEALVRQAIRQTDGADGRIRLATCIKPDAIVLRLARTDRHDDRDGLLPKLRDAAARLLGPRLLPDGCASAAAYLGRLLAERGLAMATAESCTGGLIAARLTDVPGSSEWFLGATVTYANAWKERLLGVADQTLRQHGAVSEPTVHQMLDGLHDRWGADAGVAVSGIAGPGGGTPEKPVGTVVVGAFAPGWRHVTTLHLHGSRQTIRQRSADACIQLLIRGLLRLEP